MSKQDSVYTDGFCGRFFVSINTVDDVHTVTLLEQPPKSYGSQKYFPESNRFAVFGDCRMVVVPEDDYEFGVVEVNGTLVRTSLLDGIGLLSFTTDGRVVDPVSR